MKKFILVIAVLALLGVSNFAFAVPYANGNLKGDGLVMTGVWSPDTKMVWSVTRDLVGVNYIYTYNYTLTTGGTQGDISHMIIETSPSFTINNIISTGSASGSYEVGTFKPTEDSGTNPKMPTDLHGIKFNGTGKTLSVWFTSYRSPVLGDFYAKDGVAGGEGINTVYNSGFTVNDKDLVMANHILVPDSNLVPDTNVVPEPGTILAALSILAPAAMIFRRRK